MAEQTHVNPRATSGCASQIPPLKHGLISHGWAAGYHGDRSGMVTVDVERQVTMQDRSGMVMVELEMLHPWMGETGELYTIRNWELHHIIC